MPVRSLVSIDVPFKGITLHKWYPCPLGVVHKMSSLTADESGLYQYSHTSLTLWLRLILVLEECAKDMS